MTVLVFLGQYESRGWRGFHHHATLCIAACGFLIMERAAFPPSADAPAPFVTAYPLPEGFRPRGSPVRPERHVETSVTTIRMTFARALARKLPLLPMANSHWQVMAQSE